MLEVLVATMHQTDLSLYKKMNIQSNVIFANQSESNNVLGESIDGHKVTMVTTNTRGVGKNRNIALAYSSADILLFADDDVVYNNNYVKEIETAFYRQQNADVMVFGIEFTKNGKICGERKHEDGRLHIWSALKYGTYVVAIKKKSLLKANLHFTELFGGGCIYGSGEDSLFILDCFKKGLKVYTSCYCLGTNADDESTWFQGFNEKYFYDKGAFFACAFPVLKYILCLYYSAKMKKLCTFSFWKIVKLYLSGVKGFSILRTYQDFIQIGEDNA